MAAQRHMPRLKRAYESPGPEDGTRVLVERLWPRGLSKERARIDLWLKEVAPSTALRKWYGHDPAKFEEFRRRYLEELASGPTHAALGELRALLDKESVTLVYATRDAEYSCVAVLRDVLGDAD